jgi:hypothetical protein
VDDTNEFLLSQAHNKNKIIALRAHRVTRASGARLDKLSSPPTGVAIDSEAPFPDGARLLLRKKRNE